MKVKTGTSMAPALVLAACVQGQAPTVQSGAGDQRELAIAREAYQRMPDTAGTGPFPAMKEEDPGLPDHTVYRPKDLAAVRPGRSGSSAGATGAVQTMARPRGCISRR
jgi:hypothetical protein